MNSQNKKIEKIARFLSNLVDLCLMRSNRFPTDKVRGAFKRWALQLRTSFIETNLAAIIEQALTKLSETSNNLAESLELELDAILELQDYVLRSKRGQQVNTSESPTETAPQSIAQHNSRALSASKSLLNSLREALSHLLPDWAKGLIKVGEELIEIYGPTR
jgi:hypothetical protein